MSALAALGDYEHKVKWQNDGRPVYQHVSGNTGVYLYFKDDYKMWLVRPSPPRVLCMHVLAPKPLVPTPTTTPLRTIGALTTQPSRSGIAWAAKTVSWR